MQRDQSIAIRQAVFWNLYRTRKKADKGIDHYIPYPMNFFRRNSFPFQIYVGIFRRCKQEIRELVCHQPVDLFRHGSIKGTQAGFHMSNRHL